jgi:hypothetical protein
MHSTSHAHEDGGPRAGHASPTSWAPLALLAVAQFMVVLDITIVNVALPSIGGALGFAAADLQWVVTAYVLCSGGLLLAGGRAADLLGRRAVFLAASASSPPPRSRAASPPRRRRSSRRAPSRAPARRC